MINKARRIISKVSSAGKAAHFTAILFYRFVGETRRLHAIYPPLPADRFGEALGSWGREAILELADRFGIDMLEQAFQFQRIMLELGLALQKNGLEEVETAQG